MNKIKIYLMLVIATICFLTFQDKAYAPIFGIFPGISQLIEESDAIIVADIIRCKEQRLVFSPYEVIIAENIKGNLSKGQRVILSLRPLPLSFPESLRYSLGFKTLSRYILFLKKNKKIDEDRASYSSLNYEGNHYEISQYTKLENLKNKTEREIIAELLKDFIQFKKEELKISEKNYKTLFDK